jgi:hypothetical protein
MVGPVNWPACHLLAAVLVAGTLIAGPVRSGETRCWFDNGALVVPAAFGDIAGDFILDASAPTSQLHVTRAQSAGIQTDAARADLQVAGQRIAGFPMAVADLDSRSKGFTTNIAGVLAADALEPFVVDIDFAPCRVRFSRRAPAALAGAVRLRVRTLAGVPTVAAAISDGLTSRAGFFAIDTGWAASRIAQATYSRTPPPGADPAARLRAISLAGRLFEQTPAGLMDDSSPRLAGAIGAAVWSRFHVRLMLRRGWLELTGAR